MSFQQPLDIVNQALKFCGLPKMGTTMDNQLGQEIIDIYDDVRTAELRRNLWTFATRTTGLRALDTTSSVVNFPAYSASTTYAAGQVATSGNKTWKSLVDGNIGNLPGLPVTFGSLPWDNYYGPVVANTWNDTLQNPVTTTNISYHVGELVYLLTTGAVYVSLVEQNQNEPDLVDAWSSTLMYVTGAVVNYNSVNYQSIVNQNFGYQPDISGSQWTTTITNPTVSLSWQQLAGATLSTNPITYPVTAGPASDVLSRNAFRKPAGYLRMAVQSPKAGANGWLGAHVGLPYDDITEEGKFFTSASYTLARVLRFVVDVTDVSTMDPMFCNGFAARCAWNAAPVIAPRREEACRRIYNSIMDEARLVDAIEEGPVEQDEDEFITCRL